MFQPKLTGLVEHLPTWENFIVGDNVVLVEALHQWLSQPSAQVFYLYGKTGAGSTHLLKASALPYVDAAQNVALTSFPQASMVALDHVAHLDACGQQVFFDAFNTKKQFFLIAGNQPPMYLNLRDDVKNRLGTGLIYRLKSLECTRSKEVLQAWAKQEGVGLSDSVLNYILMHAPQDMKSLQTLLKKADDYCFMHKRALTVPLVRHIMENPDEFGSF